MFVEGKRKMLPLSDKATVAMAQSIVGRCRTRLQTYPETPCHFWHIEKPSRPAVFVPRLSLSLSLSVCVRAGAATCRRSGPPSCCWASPEYQRRRCRRAAPVPCPCPTPRRPSPGRTRWSAPGDSRSHAGTRPRDDGDVPIARPRRRTTTRRRPARRRRL